MARRNVWTSEETRALLSIIKERDLIKAFGEEQNKKLYNLVHHEMCKRGFPDKGSFQVEHKWKNLKRVYYKTKREDYLTESCEFFDELDELMSSKPPPVKKIKESTEPKRPRAVLENFDKLLSKVAVIERENNEEFFRKQKDLVNYEFELYTQDERLFAKKLSQLLEKSAEDFCNRAQRILIEEGVIAGTLPEIDIEEEKLELAEEEKLDLAEEEKLELAEEEKSDAVEDNGVLMEDGPADQVIEQLEEETVDTVDEVVEEDAEDVAAYEKKEIVKEFYQTWKEEEPF
ncbi:uncharacterized protein LOC128273206 [Anopheles cruzii]|uniref:uncharacterized protein LOC128273206 n=1 Tax=Anopheles cruzii TaxID=68878 RepID=UPI0022EC248B|nr:uncharacterized protein LOC128273206 [Anopheles cruzii]